MAQRSRRFEDTTEHLRDTASRLLLERGVRELTLEAVADHGYASVGSVYERWPSRAALLDDLVESRFEPLWASTLQCAETSLAERLAVVLDSERGREVGVWLVELLHLARDSPDLAGHARSAVERFADWCRVGEGRCSHDATERGAQWWVLANAVGHAQLLLGGAAIPELAVSIARLASNPWTQSTASPTVDVTVDDLPKPDLPEPRPLDNTGQRLVGVTRRLIAEAGGDTSIRAVLAETGLASGSLYRRFASKRDLILVVLQHELRTASYDWVQGLVDATTTSDPIGALAKAFRDRFDHLDRDPHTRNVLLELTVQARTDDALRRTVIGQVEHVAGVRAAFFERFAEAGVLARGLSPDVCGWLVQCPAAGFRLLVGAGLGPEGDDVEAAVARVFWNVLAL